MKYIKNLSGYWKFIIGPIITILTISSILTAQYAEVANFGTVNIVTVVTYPSFVSEVSRSVIYGETSNIVSTVSNTIPVGSTAYVMFSRVSGLTLDSVTDSKGNIWTVHGNITDDYILAAIASSKITNELVNGDTVTCTCNSDGGFVSKLIAIGYLSGCSTTQPDSISTAQGWSPSYSALANNVITTTNSHTVILSCSVLDNTSSIYSVGTWTKIGDYADFQRRSLLLYKTVSSSGTNFIDGTWDSGGGYATINVSFK